MAYISQLTYDDAPPENQEAFRHEQAVRGKPSNMKATLLHSVPAHAAYMQWYPLWDEVKKLLGLRGAVLYAHAISTTNNCLLCSTYFRKALTDLGTSPDKFEVSAEEEPIVALGYAAANHAQPIDPKLWAQLEERFSERDLVNLVAFAGLMVATNLFNNLVQVEVDDVLTPYVPRAQVAETADVE
ncbi:putative transmembrane protein [Hyphomicrobium sulfonivorans]|uniref:Putative transmembrane protein n=1 Tax=Hyphomicrobium sulfonivorans TaxID=121290 RepID=A0A125NVA1_HYPSL|nr:hypothetical protein [Hyphomicrobium sulfonivorans]KWT69074.1 putative transmembrane protein [Hyphomicrobium sulfonivorans]